MPQLFALSLGLAAMVFAATQSQAQAPNQCGPRDEVMELLETRYGEARQAIGLAGPAQVMEVFASATTGSWTITVSMPDGMTCLVASGQNFEIAPIPLASADQPA